MTSHEQSYIDAGLAQGLDLEALIVAAQARQAGASQPTFFPDDGPAGAHTVDLPADAAVDMADAATLPDQAPPPGVAVPLSECPRVQ